MPGGQNAELNLPFQPLLPHRVPALVVLADVAIAPFLRQMVGIVRRLVGHVGEEGFSVAFVGVDEPDQFVGVCLGRVVAFGELRRITPVLGEDRQRRRAREIRHIPVAARAIQHREIALKPAGGRDLFGVLAQMPLACHIRVIAGVLEQLGQRDDAIVEKALVSVHTPLIGCRPLIHVAEAVQVRVHATQQHRTRG